MCQTHPALYVIEEGGPLLGGFSWDPEGDRYVVGADMDFTFTANGSGPPRQLNIPVNVAGRTNVQLTVALAATDADFETFPAQQDFLNIYLDPDGSGNFTLLSGFTGNAAKSLEEVRVENGALALDDLGNVIFTGFVLSNQMFRDYTIDLPPGNASAVIRFEASSTIAFMC